jgi:hypothetical protein
MNTSKNSRKSINQQLIEGTQKHLEKSWVMYFGGKKYTVHDIIDVLERRVDSAHACTTARAALHGAIKADDALNEQTATLVSAFRQSVLGMFITSPGALADFGLSPRREPRTLSLEEKALRAEKAKATRAARHTLGPRQRQAITGSVGDDVTPKSPTPVQAPVVVPAPVAVTTPPVTNGIATTIPGNGAAGPPIAGGT